MGMTWKQAEKAIADDIKTGSGAVNDLTDNPAVNHPSYYADSKIEVIDFIEDRGFGYCLGNACKYISRAGLKNPGNKEKEIQDLQKAIWYINRRIKEVRDEEDA